MSLAPVQREEGVMHSFIHAFIYHELLCDTASGTKPQVHKSIDHIWLFQISYFEIIRMMSASSLKFLLNEHKDKEAVLSEEEEEGEMKIVPQSEPCVDR